MNSLSNVPPGFRFHPTDEELVDYYLRKKIASKKIDLDVIKDVDLYRIEPWDLQEKCGIGAEEQNEWYFFSHKDRKYPTGSRTNRATAVGFWKATGRDKPIYAKRSLVGMRKTLVFYRGRAPNGQKSDWIMHEYRLESSEHGTPQPKEEGWVVCRAFKKRVAAIRSANEHEALCWYNEQVPFMQPEQDMPYHQNPYSCKQELDLHYHLPHEQFLQLPQLESPTVPSHVDSSGGTLLFSCSTLTQEGLLLQSDCHQQQQLVSVQSRFGNMDTAGSDLQVTDWRVLDKFVASQLSQDDGSKDTNPYLGATNYMFQVSDHSKEEEEAGADQYAAASTSNSSCQIDLWK